jgi:hypothetical protein
MSGLRFCGRWIFREGSVGTISSDSAQRKKECRTEITFDLVDALRLAHRFKKLRTTLEPFTVPALECVTVEDLLSGSRFNRTVFDIMTYYFRTPEVGARALDRAPALKESFQRLSEGDAEFDDLQVTTKTVSATAKRLEAWGDSLEETLELDFPIPRLADGSIRVA